VFSTPVLESRECGFVGSDRFEVGGGTVSVLSGRVAGSFVLPGCSVGRDDSSEGGGGGDEEGFHGEGEGSEAGETGVGAVYYCSSLGLLECGCECLGVGRMY